MNAATKIFEYLKGSREELRKVVWPSRRELIQHTILVIAISLAVAFFLGLLIDFPLTLLVEQIY